MREKLNFAGAAVVVTGAGGGIGQACALVLAELDATVVLVGRTAATLDETARQVREAGGAAHVRVADVTRESDVAALAATLRERFGAVKAVINNAGDNFRSQITDLPTEKWRAIVAVDLDSVFYLCRAVIPLLLAAKDPAILNIASSFGQVQFDAFIGVSPFRYRDLFEKGRRKYTGGLAQKWNNGKQRPMIDVYYPSYFKAETRVVGLLRKKLAEIAAQNPTNQ